MKRIKAFFFSAIVICLCLVTGPDAYGQGRNIEKNYKWNTSVDAKGSFTFSNYDCDLVIHTWDKPEISYQMSVDAVLKTEEDASRLNNYIENLEFSHSSGSVHFDNRFWTSKKIVLGKKTMTLKGEKTIRWSEFKMKGELWIPENCQLILQSKYSEITMPDLYGRVALDLYNDKVYGGSINSNIRIKAKYASLEFTKMKNIEADLYNTDFEAGEIGSLLSVSKYSTFRAGNAGSIDINAYNDKYSFGHTGDIKFTDKYSDLTALKSGHVQLDCYTSSVNITRLGELDIIMSKYGKYEISAARKLNIRSTYNDKFEIDSLGTLNISESKYGVYKIGHLEHTLYLKDGYTDKFFVLSTGDFQGMKVNGKYIDVEMALDTHLSFRFNANVKYGKFDMNEESMLVRRKIKDGSALEMEAIKGVEAEGMPAFVVNGYEMKVTLSDH